MTKKRARRWVESGPLAPWMVAYARWLAGYPAAELAGTREDRRNRHPKVDERAARASEYSGRIVQTQLVTLLEQRKDVREYFERLRADSVFHAKERAQDGIARNFEARALGLEAALGKPDEQGQYPNVDHKSVEHYTRPYLEHGWPKKVEKDAAVQKFTINLFGATPEQKQRLLKAVSGEQELDEIEYEVIETEKVEETE